MAASPNQSRALAMRATRRSLLIGVCTKGLRARSTSRHPSLHGPNFYLQPQAPKIVFFYLATACGEGLPRCGAPDHHSHTESSRLLMRGHTNLQMFGTHRFAGVGDTQICVSRQGKSHLGHTNLCVPACANLCVPSCVNLCVPHGTIDNHTPRLMSRGREPKKKRQAWATGIHKERMELVRCGTDSPEIDKAWSVSRGLGND